MDKIYTIHEIQSLANPILQEYDVERAYLFGSYARGSARVIIEMIGKYLNIEDNL